MGARYLVRDIVITSTDTGEVYARKYLAELGMTDSDILNDFLSFIDPGNEYTVAFSNSEIAEEMK